MFDGPDAKMIRMMAEFVKQILPVCAVFAGVTLAVAFVQRGTRDGDAVICWAAPTDQGFDFDTVGINRRMPREFDGLKLVSFAPPEKGAR